MTELQSCRHLIATALASALFFCGSAAGAQARPQDASDDAEESRRQTTFLDLEAGVGYSTNAALGFNPESSAYGRLSASGAHSWLSETGSISVRGYLENTTYVRGGYGSKQIFSLGASTTQQLSQTVSVYGDLGFSGDFGGQLSNRLYPVPSQPAVPDPLNPLPAPTVNPDLFGITGRQYRINGDAGISIASSARSNISFTAGAAHAFSSGDNQNGDYTTYHGSASYSQQISERTHGGARLTVARQDFEGGGWSNTINPALFASTQLSESLRAEGSIGVMRIHQESNGRSDTSTNLSFSGSLCNSGTASSLCAQISRDAQTALTSGVIGGQGQSAITTTASVNYWRRLGPKDTIQASISASRYSTAASIDGEHPRSTYASAVVGYDRNINSRLYGGIQGGVRRLFQTGPDPDIDLNATVYLRYRLGDL